MPVLSKSLDEPLAQPRGTWGQGGLPIRTGATGPVTGFAQNRREFFGVRDRVIVDGSGIFSCITAFGHSIIY